MTDNQAVNANEVSTKDGKLVISRTFNAPRELVFKVFTEAEHLKHWWGPKGLDLEVVQLDLRPGGIFLYTMSTPDGQSMWGKFVYQEIAAPEKLSFFSSFSNPEGGTERPPFAPQFPLQVLNMVTFTENEGQTTIKLEGGPHEATAEENAFYKGMFESMQQGFGGTFDKLDDYLASL
ncbi:SRPBCC domain-containing protein [Paenibacillus sp. CF384]|uniref:SRPBCC family protein n=1 Tax=Paenibacillus sp. CF384 TaxID=1884382 RepID=UPI00089D76AB|nr:SRPBCC domain-containing protein [Paenibacillus sp. CF384]SDX56693.1 Uncharacterized conserved protein YndB, AHSA1/START domain [Paenibacillus sp. CF384]